MLKNFIFIANNILIVMTSLSSLFGWYDKLSLVMAVGYITTAFACVRFLAMCNKKWDVRLVPVWLLIDIVGFLYFYDISAK